MHVGEETAGLLSQAISNFQFPISKPSDILKAFEKMTIDDLMRIPDIGPKVAGSIHDWFKEERNVKFLKKLTEVGVRIEKYETRSTKQVLRGKGFVLTGSLESMTRDEAKNKIRELGGDVSESVSKKTDYVIVGSEPGSKLKEAKKLGVKTIDEKEFIHLIGEK